MNKWVGVLLVTMQANNLLASICSSSYEWTMPDFQETDPTASREILSLFPQEFFSVPEHSGHAFNATESLPNVTTNCSTYEKETTDETQIMRHCPYVSCNLVFASNQGLAGHLRGPSHQAIINCNDAKEIVCACKAIFTEDADFFPHLKKHPRCAKALAPKKARITDHANTNQQLTRKIDRCPVSECRFAALSKQILASHKFKEHPLNPPRDTQKNILCPCGRIFLKEKWRHFTKHLLQSWQCESSIINGKFYSTAVSPCTSSLTPKLSSLDEAIPLEYANGATP